MIVWVEIVMVFPLFGNADFLEDFLASNHLAVQVDYCRRILSGTSDDTRILTTLKSNLDKGFYRFTSNEVEVWGK